MFLTSTGMRLSRGMPIEGTAPMRLMMSENRSSSVIFCSVSRARSSGASSVEPDCVGVVCAKAVRGPLDPSRVKAPVSVEICRRLNHVRITLSFKHAPRQSWSYRKGVFELFLQLRTERRGGEDARGPLL